MTGIVDLPTNKSAILEFRDRRFSTSEWAILREGQRQGDLEIVAIDPLARSVQITRSGTREPVVLKMKQGDKTSGIGNEKVTFMLQDTDVRAVTALYGNLCGRTVLRSPLLSEEVFTIKASPADHKEAVDALERLFAQNEIAIIKDGEKFVMMVARSEAKKVRPRSSELKSARSVSNKEPPGTNDTNSVAQTIPAGMIDFRTMDIDSILHFYSELINAKPDFPQPIRTRSKGISFQTQTPLTLEEAAYAIETLFNWEGYKPVRGEDGWVRLERLEAER